MAGVVSRESYFEAGLEVLSDLGYGGLKLAEVCNRLGVTTGSFYHYFASWSAYTTALVAHWLEARTTRLAAEASTESNPRLRIDTLIQQGLSLPHGAEAAIRIWSSLDRDVQAVQAAVDQQRFDMLCGAALEILGQEHQAQVFASWAMYLLIGYEQATLPRSADDLAWIAAQLCEALDSGRFGSVPDAS